MKKYVLKVYKTQSGKEPFAKWLVGIKDQFAIEKANTILLILGGDKSSQSKDILNARIYWHDYLRRNKHE